jgi:hypothetical protein
MKLIRRNSKARFPIDSGGRTQVESNDLVERFHWGEASDALGEDGNESLWDTRAETSSVDPNGIESHKALLFSSKLRKLAQADLQGKGDAIADRLFREHDAYLPNMNDMPWNDEGKIASPLGPAAFSVVHFIQVREP